MVRAEILDSVRLYLRTLIDEGLELSFGVLFGSQVKGNTHRWSDIDLVVVAPKFDGDYEHKDVSHLWGTAGVIDSRIEPIPCGERQWEEDNGTPIIWIARKEGIKVTLEEETRL